MMFDFLLKMKYWVVKDTIGLKFFNQVTQIILHLLRTIHYTTDI